MCGIAGYAGENKETEKLSIMTESIRHRGPDDIGFYESKGVGFGFRRLSIIDLSTGHQPIGNEDESVWVMLNGEIYNYLELREKLISLKHNFKTTSDTEVIVHGYEEWGLNIFEKIDGMFAIAIWDSKNKKLILGRDRFGKKPLYWTIQNKTLWFASELKSLINAKVFEKEIDKEAVSLFFNLDYIPTPKTIFKEVFKLEPATILEYQNEKISKKQFWSIKKEDFSNYTETEIIEKIKEKIDKAVKKRLMSDVPLGLFLSGGLDSTIVAESASRLSPEMNSFTVGFNDKSYDESSKAESIAKKFDFQNKVEILDIDNMISTLDEAVELLDEPLGDPSILPQLLLSKFTKKHVTVVLSGDGGDELLLGYQHIKAHLFLEKYDFLNKKIFKKILSIVPSGSGYFSLGFKLQRLSRGIGIKNRLERDLAWRGGFLSEDLKKLFNKKFSENIDFNSAIKILRNYSDYFGESTWSGWAYSYLRGYLMDDVLVKVDRATMRHGLESRAPLLDTEVVSLLLNLPDKYKLGKFSEKGLFKKILENKIDRGILNSPKHGFGVPVAEWINGPLYEKLIEVTGKNFIEKQGIFNRDFIVQMIIEHKTGKLDRRKELWSYLLFQLWYKRWNS